MKKFTKIMSAAVLAAASLSLSGCQDEDFGFNASEIAYKTNFVKAFGKIDPNQDWNLATRASVTVTTSGNDEVKVYAKTDGTYRIVADYAEVSGTQEIGFDMLENVTELLVTNGSESYYVAPGQHVSFGAATRAIYAETADGVNKAGVTIGDYVEFDATKYVGAVVKKDHEHPENDGILPEETANLGKVTQNFSYISNGPFTIHPIYWNTSSSHILGVYWKDGNTYHYQDVFKDMDAAAKDLATRSYGGQCSCLFKEPEVGMVCKWGHGTIGEVKHEDGQCKLYNTDGNLMTSCNFACFENDIHYSVGDVCPTHGEILYIDPVYSTRYTEIIYTGIGGTATETGMIYSKGITIDLPIGTQFGFYLKVYTSGTYYHTLYSQGELNVAKKGDFFNTTDFPTETGANACKVVKNNGLNTEGSNAWAATFQTEVDGQTVQYLCFEDWSYSLTDLNDLVFATPVTPGYTPPSIVDEEAQTWVICAEDLGNTFDLDYNDVVVEVSHVSGRGKATITPMAAGGTLASYIYFNNGTNDECLGEIHELLGQQNTTSGNYTPFNVEGTVSTTNSRAREFIVSTDWSLASSTVGDASFNSSTAVSMGGFYVKVVPAGTSASQNNAAGSQKIQNSFTSGSENVPYVFCVPRNWERTEGSTKYSSWFRWSNELTPMSTLSGYNETSYNESGHSFAEWVADHNAATDWYKYPDIDETTGIKGITETPVSVDPGDLPVDPTPGPTGNDYSALGTSVTVDTETIQYASLIATSNLPTTGSVTFTYVFSMEGQTFVNIQNPYIKGKFWNDSNQYTQYWDDVTLGNVTVSDIITGNPNYLTISITVEASAYANCTYINFGAGYCNGSLIGAYYKEL